MKIKTYTLSDTLIGRGSFASVYKGTDIQNNNVAIKKISIEKKKYNTMIENELQIVRKLNHINIIKIHDIIHDRVYNHIYLILDYYKNGDLANFLKGKSLKEKFSRKYSIQLKNGIQYLINNNILHRDLKPQNILISDTYIIKITDFGFARYFTKDSMIETVCGSPLYMAPEIMSKNCYTIKSDLWSIGIIIYEMLYGKVPFKGSNIFKLMNTINNTQIYFDKNYLISKSCKELLKRLLEKNHDNRCSWEYFFNHEWLSEKDSINAENELLNFSISNNILPIKNNFTLDENQFNSFKYKSICDTMDTSLEFNFHLNDEKNSQSLSISSDDSFMSCESEDNFFAQTSNNTPGEYNSFIMIAPTKEIQKQINLPKSDPEALFYIKKSLSNNVKKYINSSISSSINFVKQSYEYISNSSL
jgi:serine/threonine protein kinase